MTDRMRTEVAWQDEPDRREAVYARYNDTTFTAVVAKLRGRVDDAVWDSIGWWVGHRSQTEMIMNPLVGYYDDRIGLMW